MDEKKMKAMEMVEAMNLELKQRFPGMTDEMIKAARDQNLKSIQKFYNPLIERNKALENELGAARRVIWAILSTVGVEVKVPDKTMAMAGNEDNQITTRYDPEELQTVFSAKENDSRIITDF